MKRTRVSRMSDLPYNAPSLSLLTQILFRKEMVLSPFRDQEFGASISSNEHGGRHFSQNMTRVSSEADFVGVAKQLETSPCRLRQNRTRVYAQQTYSHRPFVTARYEE